MSLHGPNIGANHLYAVERHRSFVAEAEHDRLLRQIESARPARRLRVVHALGGALIRVGAWLQGGYGPRPLEDVVACAVSRGMR